jgi:hypothetical protein
MSVKGWFASKVMHAFYPLVVARSYQAMTTDSWLADVEADHDNWEPDELWAAIQRHPAGGDSPSPARGSAPTSDLPPDPTLVQPAAADSGRPIGGGRHSQTDHRTDEQVIEELVEDFRAFITDCFDKRHRN